MSYEHNEPMTRSIPSLIHAVADRHGDRLAISRLDAALTYAELAAASQRVAQSLTALGVRRGDRVGLYQLQTLETLVALHGILLAGGAYVPIDPQQPPARVAAILKRCDVRVLFSNGLAPALVDKVLQHGGPIETLIGSAPEGDGFQVVPWRSAAAGLSDRRLAGVKGEDLAYLIFTSGSTGLPKGIVHTHRSALTYAQAAADLYGLGPEDRIAGIAPLHFDQSTFHLFSAPVAAAAACLVPEAHARLPASLARCLETDDVSVIYTVPYLLIQLLLRGGLDQVNLERVRWVLFGGEPFPAALLNRLMARLPHVRFSNVYGPAEVNQCTYFHLPQGRRWSAASVPVGQAWPEAEIRIVSETGDLAEAGERGELWVRSETMMQRYWGGAEDDPSVFAACQDPAGNTARFYRTGDRFSQDTAGRLWFVGRMDRQVKVRGQRLDLDEVEMILQQHSQVNEAAAFLVAGQDNVSLVAAAVIPSPGPSPDCRELRRYLAQHLPPAAVPQSVEVRDCFPRTGSDKIDRRALAEAGAEAAKSATE